MNKAIQEWQTEYAKIAKAWEDEKIRYKQFIEQREALRARLGFETTTSEFGSS